MFSLPSTRDQLIKFPTSDHGFEFFPAGDVCAIDENLGHKINVTGAIQHFGDRIAGHPGICRFIPKDFFGLKGQLSTAKKVHGLMAKGADISEVDFDFGGALACHAL